MYTYFAWHAVCRGYLFEFQPYHKITSTIQSWSRYIMQTLATKWRTNDNRMKWHVHKILLWTIIQIENITHQRLNHFMCIVKFMFFDNFDVSNWSQTNRSTFYPTKIHTFSMKFSHPDFGLSAGLASSFLIFCSVRSFVSACLCVYVRVSVHSSAFYFERLRLKLKF